MNNELQHWGIKGQKWGVRRFQNEDGSLTDEGKVRYMYAARHNKLDYKKLSDKDLDMINNRFNKENIYKRNVENAMANSPSTKPKKAAIKAAKTLATGTKSGASWVGVLLGTPIKKAFEDAFNFNSSSSKGNKGKNEKKEEEESKKKAMDYVRGYHPEELTKEEREAHRRRGERFMEEARSSEDVMRKRYRESNPKKEEKRTAAATDSRPRNLLGLPSGGIHMDSDEYSIHSELMHYGIKGQKWGVRRFRNEDRTLTEADKE